MRVYSETSMHEKFTRPYNPTDTEQHIYERWEQSGFFNPDNLPGERSEPYAIIMPPPNANGSLHVGHALFVTLQDVLIRFKRMRGFKTLWLPGADHAGFETQVVYEKKLEKEGRSRFQMAPEELYKEIQEFTLANKSFMDGQLRQLGASCDWSRSLFTLDERVITTVYDTFKKLHEDKLLYRGTRIVNWCPKHQTSLSNLETKRITRTDKFYYFKYGPFTIGTARPETKFGDKYVVMHPDDPRYAQYTEGQTLELEWINGPITATVIKDTAVDQSFGSGVMTITPWHDPADFEIAERHHLPKEQVIDWRGKLLPIAGEFAGLSIAEARPKIVEKLQSKGLVERIDEQYTHEVPLCYRCEREIEPQVKEQWFVSMRPLAERALAALAAGEVRFVSETQEKIFVHWLQNIQDWNISRQIVWGIPIPAWQRDGQWKISQNSPGEGWTRDPDTFDTWFSSGQWPFITLGYPDSPDFNTYYPTSVIETGYDILFFWVARMIMMGLYVTGRVPFRDIYLHGLVRDAQRQKMSKSKGNVINPLEVSQKYGTDALRMALLVGNTPGMDMALSEDKIRGYKHFSNKLWNIARFVLANTEGLTAEDGANESLLLAGDQKILADFRIMAADVTKDIEEYRVYMAAEKLYHFVWHTFADSIIEESKPRLMGGEQDARGARVLLHRLLTDCLKLLHPFMPFITEEIWQSMATRPADHLLMVETWPVIPMPKDAVQ